MRATLLDRPGKNMRYLGICLCRHWIKRSCVASAQRGVKMLSGNTNMSKKPKLGTSGSKLHHSNVLLVSLAEKGWKYALTKIVQHISFICYSDRKTWGQRHSILGKKAAQLIGIIKKYSSSLF